MKLRMHVFGMMLICLAFQCTHLTAQEKELGQMYADMSDAQLWALVEGCKDQSELQTLINKIPISVMAKHALAETEDSNNKNRFGKVVYWLLWTEFKNESDYKHLLEIRKWQDVNLRFEVNASIFDVQPSNVVLRKEDGSLVEVPIGKLARRSITPLRTYQRLRKKFTQRIPDVLEHLPTIATNPNAIAWPNRIAATISLRSVNGLINDGSWLLETSGFPIFIPSFETFAQQCSEGIDRTKPSGVVLMFDDVRPVVIFCLPVSDFSMLLELLKNSGFEHENDGEFKLFSDPTGTDVYAVLNNGWAYFSDSKSNLEKLPRDPGVIFEPLAREYTVSLSIKIQNFPKLLREQATNLLREPPEGGGKKPGDALLGRNGWGAFLSWPIIAALEFVAEASKVNGAAFHNVADVIEQADKFTIGWAIFSERKQTYLDLNLSALKGTQLAARMTAASSAKSKFKGFVRENSAFAIHGVTDLLDEDKVKFLNLIDNYQSQIDHATVEGKLTGQLLEIFRSAVESKKIDAAGSLLLEADAVDLVLGLQVKDGPTSKTSIANLLNTLEKEYKDIIVIRRNAVARKRVTFHRLTINIPGDQAEARKIFGETAHVVIGTGRDAIYVGVGKNAIESIVAAIDSSEKEDGKNLNGMRVDFALQPILKFAAKIEEDALLEKLSEALLKSKKDGIFLSLETKDNTQRLRFEIQEGVIGLLSVAFSPLSGNGGVDF